MYSWAEEGALGKGERTPRAADNPFPNGPSMTYFPVPFFLSSAGYAARLDTTFRTETHFGSERPDAWRVAANTTSLKVVVYVHDDPLASLDDYTKDTGRPFVPAPWVFGPRRRVSPGYQVGGVEEWRVLRQRRVPTTAIDDAVHLLPHRSELGREDELRAWTTTLHAWGYKVMAYNNPYISTSDPKSASDLAYGKERGFFAKTPEGGIGETFFISGQPQTLATIDLANPGAVAWFQDLLRRSLALGYDGWMHDFGEYVRRPWTFFGGKTGEEMHNLFPVLSAKAAHDLLAKERPNDFLFFVRSGYAGTQAYVPAVWGGDPEATFDETQGLPSMLRGGLNLGMSGVPLWGSDVTGFKCITEFPSDKEVHLRWAQLGAVSPIMMQQDACANPLGPGRTKWKLWDDDETVAVYGAMARLHTRLLPYWEVLARAANATGIPIMRHPFLLHPREPEAWSAESAFYLGPSLWAAPVVARGERTKTTWLPPGRWVDLDDYAVYEGGRRAQIPAPLAKLPLLVKDGGIVPMLDASIETLAPATEPSVVTLDEVRDVLDVVVALARGGEARVTLADGTELVARRTQASAGNPGNLAAVAADQVAACTGGCTHIAPAGAVDRLRVTTPLTAASSVTFDDVVLETKGPLARRVRWDVLRLR
jgi:alpha-glucosidase (family GH31 glycosyl hydrolase)